MTGRKERKGLSVQHKEIKTLIEIKYSFLW